jgi:hypothetical protein
MGVAERAVRHGGQVSNTYAEKLREIAKRYDLMPAADRTWLYQISGYIEGIEQGAELLKQALVKRDAQSAPDGT